jgi:hypothetical protein
LRIQSANPINRQIIADEIDLKPNALLSYSVLQKSQWRLQQHRYIRSVVFQPIPGAQPDQYDLEVQIDSRKGFGPPLEIIANALSGIGFHTYRISYANLGKTGITLDAPMRFKSSARLAQFEISIPRPAHLDLYASARYAWRDEDWDFTGVRKEADPLYRIRMHEITASVLQPIKVPKILITTSMTFRRRRMEYQNPAVSTGVGTDVRAGDNWKWISWLRFSPTIGLWDHQSLTHWRCESQLKMGIDFGWSKDALAQNPLRFSGSWEGRLEGISNHGLRRSIRWGVHAGTMTGTAFLEDHFVLGVGPEVRYPLRAHPLLREGMLGSTPLASEFLLGNLTASHDVYSWKAFALGFTAFADSARLSRLYPDQKLPSRALDVGIGIEFGAKANSSYRFALTYARDLKLRRNVVYFSTVLR